MFNNNRFDKQHLADITRPHTPVQPLHPPPTPGDEIFKRAQEQPDNPIFKRPEKSVLKKRHTDEDGIEVIRLDKEEKKEAPQKRITTFGGLLKKMKLLPAPKPKQPVDLKKIKADKKEQARRRRKKLRSYQRKVKRRLKKCWSIVMRFVNSFMAMITRSMYILHALLTVWRVTVLIGGWYWVIASWLGLMVLECLIVQFARGGKEWKWIQPCILIYLMVELPSILILEVITVHDLQVARNMSEPILGDILTKHRESVGLDVADVSVGGVTISVEVWNLLIEQSMLVLIIIARWIMPKGEMTRDQLSALLLFYLGTASDIVDFFSVIAEDEDLVVQNYTFLFTILIFWAWSMFQFVFVVSQTIDDDDEHKDGEKKKDGASDEDEDDLDEDEKKKKKEEEEKKLMKDMHKRHQEDHEEDEKNLTCIQKTNNSIKLFLGSEVWAILVSVIFQDLPYACVRIICVFYWNIRTYTNYFFTFKNVMVLILQIYRLMAVYQEHRKATREMKKKKKKERQVAWQTAILAAKSGKLGALLKARKDKAGVVPPVGAARRYSGLLRHRKAHKQNTVSAVEISKKVLKNKKNNLNSVSISLEDMEIGGGGGYDFDRGSTPSQLQIIEEVGGLTVNILGVDGEKNESSISHVGGARAFGVGVHMGDEGVSEVCVNQVGYSNNRSCLHGTVQDYRSGGGIDCGDLTDVSIV